MDIKRFFSFKRVIIVMVLAVFVYTGCTNCAKQIPIVMIRGKDLRTDKMELPLNAKRKKKLDDYLKKGGDWQTHDIVSFYKKDFYAGILGLLDDDDSKIEMTDLFIKGTQEPWVVKKSAAQWFKNRPIYGIYNTKLNRPSASSNRPFSLFDGHFWWVFYRDKEDLNWIRHVRVTLPVEKLVPPSWKINE